MTDPEIELHTKVETRDSQGSSAVRQLIVHQSVLDAMASHVSQDTTVEHGGVMLGDVDEKTGAVTITGSIAAIDAVSKVASLTFTHETWDHISDVHERSFPGKKMVGWYHSHPHFGIFLSEHDLFIHRNFFTEPWQVAYVIDPLLHQEGFFVWEDGDVARLPAWSVVSDGGTPQAHLGVNEPARGTAPPPAPPPKQGPGPIILMIAIALVALLIGGAIGAFVTNDSGDSTSADPAPTTPVSASTDAGSKILASPIDCGSLNGPGTGSVTGIVAGPQVLYVANGAPVTTKQTPANGECRIANSSLPKGNVKALTAVPTTSQPQNDVVALFADGSIASGGQPTTHPSGVPDPRAIATDAHRGASIPTLFIASTNEVFAGPIDGPFKPVGPTVVGDIQQLMTWKDQPIVRTSSGIFSLGTDRQWTSIECPGEQVLSIASSGNQLWYLSRDQAALRSVRHWRGTSSCATAVSVSSDAASISANATGAWVDRGANGGLMQLSNDGRVKYFLQADGALPIPVSNASLAASNTGLWIISEDTVRFITNPDAAPMLPAGPPIPTNSVPSSTSKTTDTTATTSKSSVTKSASG